MPHTAPFDPIGWLNESADLTLRNAEHLLITQVEGCRELLSNCTEMVPAARTTEQIDRALHLGCELFVGQVAAWTQTMQLFERLMAEQHRLMAARLRESGAVSLAPAVSVGGCAFDAFSKATRQVANFASNRFSAATLSAFQQARERISEGSARVEQQSQSR
jgi:hypothetical protein